MNNKTAALLAFVAGVAVGANWPKIKKYGKPVFKALEKKSAKGYETLMKFIAEQKERMEDTMAEAEIKKAKKKTGKATKKTGKAKKSAITAAASTKPVTV